MARRDFVPGGKARFHRKDLNIALELARSLGVTLPMTTQTEQLFATVMQNGDGDKDHTVLMTVIEGMRQ
jgi:2-hydroxy-3-oxopropionate reductase